MLTWKPSTSRTALAYSVRFMRRTVARPGLGWALPSASSEVSSQLVKATSRSLGGRGAPRSGISPRLTRRRIFSQVSRLAVRLFGSSGTTDMPAVLSLSLWQPVQ